MEGPLLRVLAFILVSAVALHFASPAVGDDPIERASLHKAFSLAQVQELKTEHEGRLPSAGEPAPALTIEPIQTEEPQQGSFAQASTEGSEEPESSSTPIPPEVPSLCEEAGGSSVFCIYTVQPGDTLSDIASMAGIGASPAFSGGQLIALSNGLDESQALQPGQELRVPLETGIVHVVGAAEVLTMLAQQYGVSADNIAAVNEIADPHALLAGSVVLIPSPLSAPQSEPIQLAQANEATEEDDAAAVEETAEPEVDEPAALEEEAPAEESLVTADVTVEEEAEPEPTEEPTTVIEEEAAEEEPVQTAAADTPQQATRSSQTANPTREQIEADFAAGFRSVGGSESALRNILYRVIPCESGYNVRAYNPAGPFYGLMQFLEATWHMSGGGDWYDAWQQGANTARLIENRDPRTQWPHCW